MTRSCPGKQRQAATRLVLLQSTEVPGARLPGLEGPGSPESQADLSHPLKGMVLDDVQEDEHR